MIHLLLIFFMSFSTVFAHVDDKKLPRSKEPQGHRQQKLRESNQNKNSPTLSYLNGVASAGFITRFLFPNLQLFTNRNYNEWTGVRQEHLLIEAVCSTTSAVVDVKPSTLNTIVGYGNIVYGGLKLLFYLGAKMRDPAAEAFFISTIVVNGVNAVYRLWYAKQNLEPVKK